MKKIFFISVVSLMVCSGAFAQTWGPFSGKVLKVNVNASDQIWIETDFSHNVCDSTGSTWYLIGDLSETGATLNRIKMMMTVALTANSTGKDLRIDGDCVGTSHRVLNLTVFEGTW